MAFKAVWALEQKRRANDKMILTLHGEMRDMMEVLTQYVKVILSYYFVNDFADSKTSKIRRKSLPMAPPSVAECKELSKEQQKTSNPARTHAIPTPKRS
jgi:hypothetical protein